MTGRHRRLTAAADAARDGAIGPSVVADAFRRAPATDGSDDERVDPDGGSNLAIAVEDVSFEIRSGSWARTRPARRRPLESILVPLQP